jgi:hypothetical protein
MKEEKLIKLYDKFEVELGLFYCDMSKAEQNNLAKIGWELSEAELLSLEPVGLKDHEIILYNN